jgi:hypothetical protein
MAALGQSAELLPGVVKEVAVARWLAEAGFPAVRLYRDASGPMVTPWRARVTFW